MPLLGVNLKILILLEIKTFSFVFQFKGISCLLNIPFVLCVITSEPNYPTFLQNVQEMMALYLRNIMVECWTFCGNFETQYIVIGG